MLLNPKTKLWLPSTSNITTALAIKIIVVIFLLLSQIQIQIISFSIQHAGGSTSKPTNVKKNEMWK